MYNTVFTLKLRSRTLCINIEKGIFIFLKCWLVKFKDYQMTVTWNLYLSSDQYADNIPIKVMGQGQIQSKWNLKDIDNFVTLL